MSFTVRFWSFSKKYNSTQHPATADATEYQCVVKDGTGIINPKIVLDLGRTADPSQYNYCRIINFGRYYFVREWTFDKGLWTANLECDVLATYRTEIGSSNLYVLRASAASNGRIIDNMYPAKVNCNFDRTAITSPFKPYYDNNGFQGCYVIGVVSEAGTYGSLKYYVLDEINMAKVCQYLINDAVSVANNFSTSDATLALQNSIVDPIQYIKSAIWLPFDAADISGVLTSNVKVFNWQIPNVTAHFLASRLYIEKTLTPATIKHPDTNTRGSYVNASPYTMAHVSFPPFGVIDLDTTVIANVDNITLHLIVDGITGKGFLEIKAHSQVLNRLEAQIGVPIQLSQISSNYIGAATSLASAVPNIIGGVMAGGPMGIAGAIAGGVGAIGNAVEALAPRAQTIGSGGAFSHLFGTFEVGFQFFRPADDDNTHNGRPLCEKRVLNTIPGYILIQDGDVEIAGTKAEGEQIRAFLEGGFYYE